MMICDMESDGNTVGWRKRRDAMQDWINKHVIESHTELSVLNAQYFDSEHLDLIKENLIVQASEDLTTFTKYDIKGNKIQAKLFVLKE